MRHPFLSAIATVFAIASLTACASRSIQYTMTKADVSQSQFIQDQKLLRDTSGVDKVIPRHDSQNGATIELYLEEGSTEKGLQTATDLGYRLVRN
jgi:hypothetical protein